MTLAIDAYEKWQKAKRLKPSSYETTHRRLSKFLCEVATKPLACITDQRARSIYSGWIATLPVDSHRNMRWCIEQGWIKHNPFAKVKGEGKRKKGKNQLRFDEARRWYFTALELGRAVPGAIAATCTLVFNLRASEVAAIAVRDLDDDGWLIWVADAKTEAGKRTLEVPAELRPHLLRLAEGKAPKDPLFGPSRTRYWVYYWVQRVCELAKVQKVCPHAMRGLHASTSVARGATPAMVVAAMGHDSFGVTRDHYVSPGLVEQAQQRAVFRVLEGGKEGTVGKRIGQIVFPRGRWNRLLWEVLRIRAKGGSRTLTGVNPQEPEFRGVSEIIQ